jgi:hypothetical protein
MRDLEMHFWGKVRIGDGCWEYTEARSKTGYGQFQVGPRRQAQAHRFSWLLAHGPIPPGMCVCHSCDNPACVRPTHLWLGTHAENMADMTRKGRQAKGDRVHVSIGSSNGNAKLTEDTVRDIRARLAAGEQQRALAAAYGASQSTIGLIARRITWRHVS